MAGIFMEPIVFLDQAVLSRWTFEARGPTAFFPSKKTSTGSRKTAVGRVQKDDISLGLDSAWTRYLFGLATSTNWRLLNTPWEVNGCPQFSAADKPYVPSRPSFLIKATAVFLACYYFMDFLIVAGRQNPPNISAFTPDKVPVFTRLGEITAEEVITRLAASIMHFVGTYCVVQSFYYATAVPCVALGSQVRDWRPAFGSLSELYTVRKFWGTFWHQFVRHMLSTPAAFIAHSVLRLPPRGFVQRYVKIFLVFAFSGALHAVIDIYAVGLDLSESGALRFFCTQALGIVLEDAVQGAWRRAVGPPGGGIGTRIVGSVWLAVFMAWSTPHWAYPYVVKSVEPGAGDAPLPLSLAVRVLGTGKR
ncbi:hypothetical protein BR93DRAFT_922317 [Coniochaeta sp. PMI_546]|nr:hypothetical protein BR93DRAFT_922317 [Coniochaeta sp. PMI_546]